MKTFKLFATALMVAMCAMVVTSCSDDDDNPSNGTNEKRLSKMIMRYSDREFDIIDLNYANGKLSKMVWSWGDEETFNNSTISYSGKTVTVTEKGFTQKLNLNNDGWAESGTLFIEDEPPYSFICEYSNGYLTKVSYPDAEDWQATKIEIKYDSNGNITNAYEYDSNGVTEFKFTYSNNPAKGKSLFFLREAFDQDDTLDLFWSAYYAGLLGKDSPNLVSKIEYDSHSITYNYTLDNDGYVEKIIVDEIDLKYPVTFTYE
ncbi:DUF4595 domain-containing protein [Bacteroides sp. OttesenSCG-928-D19]|nr:DUF4595 domain-containing protein [Bacteroides sp. OttesenSCG-928-N06]MDL2304837.1 DUF4595 domain-containing protein [Bacteroides sp. OttesenSCG-928-D19]